MNTQPNGYTHINTQEGLVHVSELSDQRIDNVEGEFKVGDKISVKVPNPHALDVNWV